MPSMQPDRTRTPLVRAKNLQDYLLRCIPQAAQMQVRVAEFDVGGVTLTAPLAPNINHEQTAFGGSIASLATLACWGYLWLLLEDTPGMHVVVNEAHIRYLKPVTGILTARCAAPDGVEQRKFLEVLARRGKARIELKAEMVEHGVLCADYRGIFVAFHDDPTSP